jgi:diaminohydroxyphosphoribosylaminopyrimidine deaminase / 5-amino-6-(5-phosphoribosylamino)uracil reductase
VVDSSGRTRGSARIFEPTAEVIVATTESCPHEVQMEWKEAGAEVLVLPGEAGAVDLGALLETLGAEGMLEVLCEGGAGLATSLLRNDLVERLELYYGPMLAGSGGASLGDLGVDSMARVRRWRTWSVGRRDDDAVIELHRAVR